MTLNMLELSKFTKWSVLGDGSVSKSTNNKDYHYSITRSPDHADYIEYIASKFRNFCNVTISRYSRKDNGKTVVSLKTASHPLFTRVRNRQYINGHRVVDPHMLTTLDWEAAAILYQDDGSLCYTAKGSSVVRISTCAYSYYEQCALADAFYKRLGVILRVNKASKHLYQLNIPLKCQDKFFEGVKNFIVPSYEYKLPTKLQGEAPERVMISSS